MFVKPASKKVAVRQWVSRSRSENSFTCTEN